MVKSIVNKIKEHPFYRLVFLISVFLIFSLISLIMMSNANKCNAELIATESESIIFTSIENDKITEEPIIFQPVETEQEIFVEEPEIQPIEIKETVITYYDCIPISEDLQNYIYELCDEYDVPYALAIALIDNESKFNVYAKSGTNDYGLMQVNKCNFEWLAGEFNIYLDPNNDGDEFLDPYLNVKAGIYIISDHLKAVNGDINLALMRYNCGAGGAQKLWNQGIYSTYYSETVMALYYYYSDIFTN